MKRASMKRARVKRAGKRGYRRTPKKVPYITDLLELKYDFWNDMDIGLARFFKAEKKEGMDRDKGREILEKMSRPDDGIVYKIKRIG